MPHPTAPSLPYKTNPAPNFFVEHSVVLDASLKDAYTILGTAVGHERVCRLSKLCTAFELQGRDMIELPVPAFPEGVELKDSAVRTAEYTYTGESENVDQGSKRTVSRQHFTMEEVVPIFFGLVKSRVILTGTMSWNDSALSTLSTESSLDKEYYALYESISNTGIMVWKLRTFSCEQGDPARTRVTERIEGWAPALLRAIVQREAVKSHRAHMDLYSTLF